MIVNRHGLLISLRKIIPAVVLIWLPTLPGLAGPAAPSFAQTNYIAIPPSNPLPARIVTTDGQIYNAVKLQCVLPDGLLVQYLPDAGGMGLARLKFTRLSESLQAQFGYDPAKASLYEQDETNVMTELSRRMWEDENIRTATLENNDRSPVSVEADTPIVSYAYYDRAGPKPSEISEGMDGDTEYAFGCNPAFAFHVTRPGPDEPFSFHIETVTMHLGLKITIIMPKGDYEKLKDHEEGHRKIVEYFYSLGPAMARQAGGLMAGIERTSSTTDYEAAKTEVFTRATDEVETEYMKYIRDLCGQANDYYDSLTDHGRNNVDSTRAAHEAIRHYAPQTPD